jgi:hypothetical protein
MKGGGPPDAASPLFLSGQEQPFMADLYLKALESERRKLWAECRLKGLAKDTPQRQRIVELDGLLAAHRARKDAPPA